MTGIDDIGAPASRASRQLRVIADILGVPVETLFTHDGAGAGADHLVELLRLWSAIRDEAGHQAILACARALVTARSGTDPV